MAYFKQVFIFACLLMIAVSAYRVNDEEDLIDSLEDYDEINNDVFDDDDQDENEQEDPRPWRRVRLRLRRIRIRLRRLKCPAKCIAYYTCLAKTAGIGKLACLPIKNGCRCR